MKWSAHDCTITVLLKAISFLSDEYQLIIAGEVYGKTDKYEKIIKELNLSSVHFFNQYIPDEEVATYFSAADVCVLPYKTATQSGVTATSFHFELPIIATNVGGLAETVVHNKTGLIVPPNDEKSLYLAIKNFFEASNLDFFKENIQIEKTKNSWSYFSKELINYALNRN
jgi:glycosyltransferase involved in cell wall biosynthesis